MRRALLILALLLLLPAVVHARGGAYRGPGGSVPPGLREPSDPTPPPPPPPSGPPPGGMSVPTVPSTPPPSTPPAPPSRPVAPQPSFPRPARIMPKSFEAWFFWYENNRDAIETPPLVEVTPAEGTPPDAGPAAAKAAILAAAKARDTEHPFVAGGALVALGKVADSGDQVDVLLGALSDARPGSQIVRESAALGLGLLRREAKHLRFDAATYDRARELLLATLEGERSQARVRGFSALGLALLGDQPTAKDPKATTARLFAVLRSRPSNPDVLVGVLRALMLQPRASFTPDQIETLRGLAYAGKLADQRANQLLRCHALSAMSVLGTEVDLSHLELLLANERDTPANVKRSAAIALGILGAHVAPGSRLRILDVLARTATHERDATTRAFAMTAMIPVFLYGPPDLLPVLVRRSHAPELLIAKAAYGSWVERPYAALTLGWLFHGYAWEADDEVPFFPAKARAVLRDGLSSGPHPHVRAAFALALGLAGDQDRRAALLDVAKNRRNDSYLRGYALLGLAHLQMAQPVAEDEAVLGAIRESMAERRNDLHRMIATRAMGMAGYDVDLLVEELGTAKAPTHKGEAAVALANVGSPEARDALVRIATDPQRHALDRGVAIAALGRMLDPQRHAASLNRLRSWLNYRASTDLINEVLSIL